MRLKLKNKNKNISLKAKPLRLHHHGFVKILRSWIFSWPWYMNFRIFILLASTDTTKHGHNFFERWLSHRLVGPWWDKIQRLKYSRKTACLRSASVYLACWIVGKLLHTVEFRPTLHCPKMWPISSNSSSLHQPNLGVTEEIFSLFFPLQGLKFLENPKFWLPKLFEGQGDLWHWAECLLFKRPCDMWPEELVGIQQ